MNKPPESNTESDEFDDIDDEEFLLEDGHADVDELDDESEIEGLSQKSVKEESTTYIETFTEGDLDATRLYLGEIGFSPLLTAEEEVYFSRKARKGERD